MTVCAALFPRCVEIAGVMVCKTCGHPASAHRESWPSTGPSPGGVEWARAQHVAQAKAAPGKLTFGYFNASSSL